MPFLFAINLYIQVFHFPKFPYFAQKFFVQQASTFTVYNASAGSGKTFTLVKEYLKILLSASNPDYFRHILAVTFTNKAAQDAARMSNDSIRTLIFTNNQLHYGKNNLSF